LKNNNRLNPKIEPILSTMETGEASPHDNLLIFTLVNPPIMGYKLAMVQQPPWNHVLAYFGKDFFYRKFMLFIG